MPIYEFECSEGHRHEEFQPMPGARKHTCPECNRMAGRVVSLVGTRIRWPAGTQRYISGAAQYVGDPEGYCGSMNEAAEKIRRQGKVPEMA